MSKKLDRAAVSNRIATALDTLSGRDVAPAIIAALSARHKGETIEADDVDFYRSDVVKRMKPASEVSKRRVGADVANMCAAYVLLPEACSKFEQKGQAPAWYIVARLAKRLKSGDTVAKAVANVKKSLKPKVVIAAADRTVETAMASVKTHIERILEHTQLPASFRKKINEAAIELGVR